MKFLPIIPLALVAGALPAGAQLHVPGDHATLQAAIDAAAPGATIVVSTPVLQGPLRIDKPLTIVGDPIANLGTEGLCFGVLPPPVQLAGPGYGTVVLAQVNARQCYDGPYMTAVLGGGGFDELHVYDSTVRSAPTGTTGSGLGNAAISVSVPYVLVSGSSVVGGADDLDICTIGGFEGMQLPYLAYPAIEAPGSLVTVVDSVVRGGSHYVFCCQFCACPGDLATIAGPGGPGVVADELLLADSTVTGGSGATVYADSVLCGTSPDGPDFVSAGVSLLAGNLSSTGPPRLGTDWRLRFVTPGPLAVLLLGFGASAPVQVPSHGWSFLGPDLLLLGPVPVGVSAGFLAPIPDDPVLLGFEVTFQIFDLSTGLSRPKSGVVVP